MVRRHFLMREERWPERRPTLSQSSARWVGAMRSSEVAMVARGRAVRGERLEVQRLGQGSLVIFDFGFSIFDWGVAGGQDSCDGDGAGGAVVVVGEGGVIGFCAGGDLD